MMPAEKLTVSGMGCDGCVSVIENAVMPLPGVAYVGVCLTGGTMTLRPSIGLDATDMTSGSSPWVTESVAVGRS